MTEPTTTDFINSNIYATQRLQLAKLECLYNKFPHLASHIQYTFRPATLKDYFFERSFTHKAIMVEIRLTQKVCDKISCNPFTFYGPCKPNEKTALYRLGDSEQFDIQCNPACYHLKNETSGTPQMLRTIWNKGKCAFVPIIATWMEMPLYRSSEKYELRVNDLSYGFNRKHNPNSTSGIGYEFNENYCKAFFDTFNNETKLCETKWYQYIANVVIGENLIKTARGLARSLINTSSVEQSRLPLPPTIDDKWLFENWSNDIDTTFVIPNPNIENATKVRTKRNTVTYSNDTSETNTSITVEDITPDSDKSDWGIREILLGILQMVLSTDFYENLLIDFGVQGVVVMVKKIAIKVIEQSTPKITAMIAKAAYSNVLKYAIVRSVTKAITDTTTKVLSRLAIESAKMFAQMSTVIGVVLIIGSVLDVLFTIWDPYSFSVQHPENYLSDLMTHSESTLRSQFNMAEPILTFDILCQLLLSVEDMISVNLKVMQYEAEYLSHLTVNSDGSIMDRMILSQKNTELNLDLGVEQHFHTDMDIQNHEKDHFKRLTMIDNLNKLVKVALIIGVMFLLFRFYVMSLIFFILSLLMTFASYYNIQPNLTDDEQLNTLLIGWGIASFLDNLISCGINYKNFGCLEEADYTILMKNDYTKLGDMITFRKFHRKWKSSAMDLQSEHDEHINDVKFILKNGGKIAEEITSFFKTNLHLTDSLRLKLVDLILKKRRKISRTKLSNIADQICIIFPGEQKNVYYEKLKNKEPTGILYKAYNDTRTNKVSRQSAVSEPLAEDLDISITDDVQSSIDFLRNEENLNENTDQSLIIHHWKNTFSYRESKKYNKATEAMNDWPPLQKIDGYILIEMDFIEKYGVQSAESFTTKWEDFLFRNLHVLSERIRDAKVKKALLAAQSENDLNIKNRICVMALHHLHFTVPSKVTAKNTNWTPTIPESKDSFLNLVKNSAEIEKQLKSQNTLNQLKNIKEHPIIYEMKNSEGIIYNIVVGDSTYECTSLIEAVDVTFKIFVILKIPFPPQSVKVWLFLNQLFYKVTLDQKPNATMISVLNSFEM